ncbi:MAG: YIP1 family protein [Candidatus Eremiobacteraeota bacterium]|nr:YIP1 family protein [Candidatus Eremiobacteraeota bacterium]
MYWPLRHVASLLVRPFATWRAIATERTSLVAIVLGYVLPLSSIGPVATFVARRFVGVRVEYVVYRSSVTDAFGQALFALVLTLAGLLLVAFFVDLLAPLFGARRSFAKALRVAAFAYTPVWLAGVVVLAPMLGFLQLLALAYEVFLLHAGLVEVMGIPRGRAGGLAACAVLGTVLLAVAFGELSAAVAPNAD